MLVFRNQTSYQRFWDGTLPLKSEYLYFQNSYADVSPNNIRYLDIVASSIHLDTVFISHCRFPSKPLTDPYLGRNDLTIVLTSLRNLTRSFLTCSHTPTSQPNQVERHDIDRTVRILIAIPTTITNSLRSEWYAAWAPITPSDVNKRSGTVTPRLNPSYSDLLPSSLTSHESDGLALPLQLTFLIEAFIKRGHDRGWFHAPQASQLTVQLNTLVEAYGRMETIRNTPYPVAIMIHQRQVLALFGTVLPLVIGVSSMWWSVPIVSLVMFTLYGIEAIASQLENPFGYDKNDIRMDDIVEDARVEMGVMLDEWRECQEGLVAGREMFLGEV